MNAKYKVSLIITVFNRERSLPRCIDSVLAQTLGNLEIIIVDDHSTDQSVSIAKKYVQRYDNITLVECSQNRGPGYAKNAGVQAACGEYIGFVDSDDYIDPDYIENLYMAIKNTGSEVAVADIGLERDSGVQVYRLSEENPVVRAKDLAQYPINKPSIIPGSIVAGFWGGASACTKLIKRESYHRFPFYQERRCDDIPATLPILAKAEQIVYVPQSIYHYCISGEESVERGKETVQRQVFAIMAIAETISRYRKQNTNIEYEKILVATSLFSVFIDLIRSDDILESQEQVKHIYHLLHSLIQNESLSINSNPYLSELSKSLTTSAEKSTIKLISMLAEESETEFVKQAAAWRHFEKDVQPKVSIIIPVYNGANYMREAIDSALGQTYSNIEVVVINDGSRDEGETDRIARSYGGKIRYFLKPNGGVATALNLGIEKMTGEYFSWLSHDDMYLPNKIEEEVRCLLEHKDPMMIIAEGYRVVDAKGKYLYTVNIHDLYTPEQLKNALFLVMRGAINGCSLLINRNHFRRVGMFDHTLPTTQDYDLWFRMFRGQSVCYMKSSNVLSRSHEEQGSKALLADHVLECNKLWIGMMEALTHSEKVEMCGSEYAFFLGTWDFLRTSTGYQEAINYAKQKTYEQIILEWEHTFEKNILEKISDISGYSFETLKNQILPLREEKSGQRILFLLGRRNVVGGLNRVVLQIAACLTSKYEVFIAFPHEEMCGGYPIPNSVKEIYLPDNLWDPPEDAALKMSYLAYLLKVDVLINSYNCDPYWLEIYKEAQAFGVHTIAWNHEFYFLPFWRSSLQHCLISRNDSLRKADVVVWLNSFSAQAYHAFCGNGIVLPNPNPFAGKKGVEEKFPESLLAVGRFDDSGKGLEDLLRMFKRVLDHRATCKLLVVGPYDLDMPIPSNSRKTYKRLIKELDLTEASLRFEGEVSDVEPYYQKACIHVLPSKYEGFGLTILEAGTMGLPSVVYGGSGMDDIITDGVDGRIVPSGNWSALADAVLELLENPGMCASMSVAAQEMVKRYSPERITDMWCDVIDTILNKSSEKRIEYLSAKYSYIPSDDADMFAAQSAQEYEQCISSLLMLKSDVATTMDKPINMAPAELLWQTECERIQQSLSWRITKPLRLIKKSFVCIKAEGIRAFLKKVRKNLFN